MTPFLTLTSSQQRNIIMLRSLTVGIFGALVLVLDMQSQEFCIMNITVSVSYGLSLLCSSSVSQVKSWSYRCSSSRWLLASLPTS